MIRLMKDTSGEIDNIMAIWLSSTIQAHDFISEEYWNKSYDLVKNTYLPQSETYVYTENGDILGFISIINKEFIGALFIKREYQRKGIGKELIEFVKSHYDVLSLAVYKENKDAVNFYINRGFKSISEQLNEDTNEPEYIMSING